MKVMVILTVLFAQQTATSKSGMPLKIHQEKLRAIFGNKIKYRLTDSTRQYIKERELTPPKVSQSGSLMDIQDRWHLLLRDEARVNVLTELAESPEHLEEARILLAEVHGDEMGEVKYTQLLDLMVVKRAIDESGLLLEQVIVRPGNKVVSKQDDKSERTNKLLQDVRANRAANLREALGL